MEAKKLRLPLGVIILIFTASNSQKLNLLSIVQHNFLKQLDQQWLDFQMNSADITRVLLLIST